MAIPFKEFLRRANVAHGDLYEYDETSYGGSASIVAITCKIHGEFSQQAYAHTRGQGCPKCKGDRISKAKTPPFSAVLANMREVHGNTFEYDSSSYSNVSTKMKIFCNQHGWFDQSPEKHKLATTPCPGCLGRNRIGMYRNSSEDLVTRAKDVHGDVYEYHAETIGAYKSNMAVTCQKHGVFLQTPDKHIGRGDGCPKCSNRVKSHAETRLYNFVSTACVGTIRGDRTVLNGKELDIYCPEEGVAVEYCGLYWHSEKYKERLYHYNKWNRCKELGIHLITMYEDEAGPKAENAILAILGKKNRGLPARKLFIQEEDVSVFLESHHLQGACRSKVSYSLRDNNGIVACMTFGTPSRKSTHAWELHRFCTDGKTHPGAASKLFSHFVKTHAPDTVVSMSDRRWFTGWMYEKLGFSWDGEVRPDYYYIEPNGRIRHRKSAFKKKAIQKKLPHVWDTDKTEKDMMEDAGYLRIYDCGKDRWVWRS